jgi:hypothetical protein
MVHEQSNLDTTKMSTAATSTTSVLPSTLTMSAKSASLIPSATLVRPMPPKKMEKKSLKRLNKKSQITLGNIQRKISAAATARAIGWGTSSTTVRAVSLTQREKFVQTNCAESQTSPSLNVIKLSSLSLMLLTISWSVYPQRAFSV